MTVNIEESERSMIGGSKILTVSYGTFSCTLEGFDEPFSTMRAIAEYFRDLAAEDRYFGAEPPTPDAEMLHRIAERELHRRVNAQIGAHGITLRPQEESAEPAAPVPEATAEVAPPQPAPPEPVQPEPAQPEPVAAAPVAEVEDDSVSIEQSVAAKLARIRAAVAGARAAAAQPAYEDESDVANISPAPPSTDFGYEIDLGDPSQSEADAQVTAEVAPPAEPAAAEATPPLAKQTPAQAFSEPAADDAGAEAMRSGAARRAARTAASLAALTAGVEAEKPAAVAAPIEAEAPQIEDAPAAEVAAETPLEIEDLEGDETGIAEAVELGASKAWGEDDSVVAASEDAPEVAATEDTAPEEIAEAAPSAEATEAEALPESAAPQVSAPEDMPKADAASEAKADEVPEAEAVASTDQEAEDEGRALDASEQPESVETPTPYDDLDWSEPEPEPEAAAEQAQVTEATSEPEAKPVRARVVKVRRADALTEATPAADNAQSDEDTLAAVGAALAESIVAEVAPTGLSPEEEAELALELAALEAEIGPAPKAPADSADEAVDDLVAETFEDSVTKTPEVSDEAAEQPEKVAKADQNRPASEIEDAEIVEAEQPSAPAPANAARLDRAATEEPAEVNLSRLLTETNTKLEGVESRRRFSAIAHLKAAVAATVADRALRSPADANAAEDDEAREIKRYRDDLTKAVRPRRPAGGTPETATRRPAPPQQRMAPLVLVSEQRIDRPQDAAVSEQHVIRPRRISAGQTSSAALAARRDYEDDEEDYDTPPLSAAEASGFAEFARKLGARELPELLEAAAAYTADIEGQPHFTRPHLIRKVAALAEQPSGFDREAGLRSFGTLLRQGKIAKVKRGQFAITEASRYYPAQGRAR